MLTLPATSSGFFRARPIAAVSDASTGSVSRLTIGRLPVAELRFDDLYVLRSRDVSSTYASYLHLKFPEDRGGTKTTGPLDRSSRPYSTSTDGGMARLCSREVEELVRGHMQSTTEVLYRVESRTLMIAA